MEDFGLKAPKGRRYTDGGKRSTAPGIMQTRTSPERAAEGGGHGVSPCDVLPPLQGLTDIGRTAGGYASLTP
ncbi:MAG: hypothetical protein IKR48_12795, partial [Kiritimatiellae bacterium]|nr:hypothetical protein [Kiritimatiellia bacterium]